MMFATGIECSYPKVQHGKRRDELEETGHYRHWREDFDLCRQVRAGYLRYGIPYYRAHAGPDRYDWSWCDEVLPVLRESGIVPILDLCHFGVPDWAGDFQNPDWPALFADFAAAFSRRYPWIRYYTPVNEILVCSRASGLQGIWNGQNSSHRTFVRALVNMCRATLLACKKIRETARDAVFFQSEAAEVVHERWPETHRDVAFANELRFLSFDLLYGHPPGGDVFAYLLDNGLTMEEYRWFTHHGDENDPHCVLGMDYYSWNERYICPDGSNRPAGPVLGWHTIGLEYFRRYHKPMMLTETNTLDPDEAPDWLWKTWLNVQYLRVNGVPVLGFTWYSLQDQVDWDIQLREIRGTINQNGLFSLDRKPHPAAQAFREVAERYGAEPVIAED